MKKQIFSGRLILQLTLIIGFMLVVGNAAYALPTINSDILFTREFNDIPGATLTTVNNYPSFVFFSEASVSNPTGFANRDVWRFSSDGGASAYQFQNNDFFYVFMSLTLTGNPVEPRKEAGFLLSNSLTGDGQFIVDTDAHEIVVFGGALPFYSFGNTYNSGDTITLSMTYFLDGNNKRAIIYSANGVNSPALEFTNLEQGIGNNSRLGGYFQIVNDPSNSTNSGSALFGDIFIGSTAPVPEPSTMILLGGGLLGLIGFSRKFKK